MRRVACRVSLIMRVVVFHVYEGVVVSASGHHPDSHHPSSTRAISCMPGYSSTQHRTSYRAELQFVISCRLRPPRLNPGASHTVGEAKSADIGRQKEKRLLV